MRCATLCLCFTGSFLHSLSSVILLDKPILQRRGVKLASDLDAASRLGNTGAGQPGKSVMNIQGVVGRVEEQAASRLIARADEHLKGDPAEGLRRTAAGGHVAGGSRRLRARRTCRARARSLRVLCRTQAGQPEDSRHQSRRTRQMAAQQGHHRHRDRQRRHAVPGRFGDGGIDRPGGRDPAGRASDLHRVAFAIGHAGRKSFPRGTRAVRAKASSTFTSSASTTKQRARRSSRSLSARLRMSAPPHPTGGRCWRGSAT